MCFGGEVLGERMVLTLAEAFLAARFRNEPEAKALVSRLTALDP
jgi:ribose 5-phosphate isomerase RpiB